MFHKLEDRDEKIHITIEQEEERGCREFLFPNIVHLVAESDHIIP